MSPDLAAQELLEALGDGKHVLQTFRPRDFATLRNREHMREIFTSLVLLTEKLRQGVENTELKGWYPELTEEGETSFILKWPGGKFTFFLSHEGVRYSYKNEQEGFPITRMTGESLAEAAVRLVFNTLRPVYTPSGPPLV